MSSRFARGHARVEQSYRLDLSTVVAVIVEKGEADLQEAMPGLNRAIERVCQLLLLLLLSLRNSVKAICKWPFRVKQSYRWGLSTVVTAEQFEADLQEAMPTLNRAIGRVCQLLLLLWYVKQYEADLPEGIPALNRAIVRVCQLLLLSLRDSVRQICKRPCPRLTEL